MRPLYQVVANGGDITAAVRDRLIALTVTDAAGIDSDTLEIRLDDRGGAIDLPPTGARLEVWVGWEGQGLSSLGSWVVDEIALDWPPHSLKITAKAADMKASAKAPRTRSWHDTTLGAIVGAIAAEHGLTPAVTPELAAVAVPHADQTEESDLHFLTRLAKDHGAVAKPTDGHLVFVPRGQGRTAAGRAMPTVSLVRSDVLSGTVTLSERGVYGAVEVAYHDPATGERRVSKAGGGEPVKRIARAKPTEAEAAAQAQAELASAARGKGTLSIRCLGRADIQAEGRVALSGIRSGVDGLWTVTQVTHTLDNQGWLTAVEGELPDA